MSDIVQENKSVDGDFKYDVKYNKREFFNNPGKDRFVIEADNNYTRKYDRGKLGHLRQRDFPMVPKVSLKDVREVDYDALRQWQSSQPQSLNKLRSGTNNYNKSMTMNELLLSAESATQPRDYKSGSKSNQGSILSIGRDLQMKQVLLRAVSKQVASSPVEEKQIDILNRVVQKYKNGDLVLIAADEEEEKKNEELMLSNKIYLDEPLNEYNSKLLKHLQSTNEKLERDINELRDRLGGMENYHNNFVNLINVNGSENINLVDQVISEYSSGNVRAAKEKLHAMENDLLKLDQFLATSINKNLQDTKILKLCYSETEKRLNKRLGMLKIFNTDSNTKKMSGSDYINEYLSSNGDR